MNLSRRQTVTGGLALLALPTLASAQSTSHKIRAGTELNNIYENLLKDGHGFSKKDLPGKLTCRRFGCGHSMFLVLKTLAGYSTFI